MASAVTVVNDVAYSYNNAPSSLVLDSISFTVNEGDLLGIIGPNGAGKSTLFKCMLGLIGDYRGQITIFDHNIRKNKNVLQKVGYIPQIRSIEQNFPATVQEIVSLGITGKKTSTRNKEKIISAIDIVDLSEHKNERIGELSGGQAAKGAYCKIPCE